jgi:hypothetical protein
MATKSHPILDMFEMIKHDPNRLEVATRLISLHQIKSIPLSTINILKRNTFSPNYCPKKTIILDIVITTIDLER